MVPYFNRPFTLSFVCAKCKADIALKVDLQDVRKFVEQGVPVQRAFPYLNDTEREMIHLVLCKECVDKLYEGFDAMED